MNIGDWLAEHRAQKTGKEARSGVGQAQQALQVARSFASVQNVMSATALTMQAAQSLIKSVQAIAQVSEQVRSRVRSPSAGRWPQEVMDALAEVQSQAAHMGEVCQLISTDPRIEVLAQRLDELGTALTAAAAAEDRAGHAMQELHGLVEQAEQKSREAQKAQQQHQRQLAQFGGVDPEAIIQQVQAGKYPSVAAGIVLQAREVTLYSVPAQLSEDKTTTRYVGHSTGFSIPMGHGMRSRVSSYHGHAIHTEKLTHIDQGSLVVTTQRIVFIGKKRTIAIPAKKVLNTVLYHNGVDIRSENRQKREVFLCRNPLLLNTYVLVACQLAT